MLAPPVALTSRAIMSPLGTWLMNLRSEPSLCYSISELLNLAPIENCIFSFTITRRMCPVHSKHDRPN